MAHEGMGEQLLQRDLHGLLGVAVLVVVCVLVLQRRAQRLDPAIDQFGEPVLDDDTQLVADFVPPARNGAHQCIAIEAADRQHGGLEAVEHLAAQRHQALAFGKLGQPCPRDEPPGIEGCDHLTLPGRNAGV